MKHFRNLKLLLFVGLFLILPVLSHAKGTNALLRKYNVNSASRSFNKKMGAALKFYESIKFGARERSVHPKTLSWLRSTFRKWSNQREFQARYRSDTGPTISAYCDSSIAAFASSSVDGIVFCPKGFGSPMVMAGHFVHEIRHLDVGGRQGIGHVTCRKGKLKGQDRCDESFFAHPLSAQNGAYAATVFYYQLIYKMGKNVSAYQRRQAQNYGEFYINTYINRPKQNRAVAKKGKVWVLR